MKAERRKLVKVETENLNIVYHKSLRPEFEGKKKSSGKVRYCIMSIDTEVVDK